jgi:hypothetical protein
MKDYIGFGNILIVEAGYEQDKVRNKEDNMRLDDINSMHFDSIDEVLDEQPKRYGKSIYNVNIILEMIDPGKLHMEVRDYGINEIKRTITFTHDVHEQITISMTLDQMIELNGKLNTYLYGIIQSNTNEE